MKVLDPNSFRIMSEVAAFLPEYKHLTRCNLYSFLTAKAVEWHSPIGWVAVKLATREATATGDIPITTLDGRGFGFISPSDWVELLNPADHKCEKCSWGMAMRYDVSTRYIKGEKP